MSAGKRKRIYSDKVIIQIFGVMRTYFIRTSKTAGEAPLYVRAQKRTPKINMMINTGIIVDIAKWNKAFCSIELYARGTGKQIEKLVKMIDTSLDDAIAKENCTEQDIRDAVEAITMKDVREARALMEEEQRKDAERQEQAERIAKAREDSDVRAYLAHLIRGMKDGSIRVEGRGKNKGDRYTPSTVKMWNSLAGIIGRYYEFEPFTWDSIDKKFAARFRAWMESEGYMPKTTNKYIGQFVALINRSYFDGKHTNDSAANCFLKPAIDEAQKAAEIYLTAEELNALYEMPLTGIKELVRDIFIVGCCTCQRVSDYSNLKRENFTTTARGTKVVKLRQTKTKNLVTIPILDGKLTAIMEKYDYNLPQLPKSFDVILNRYIKEICKELAETVPSLKEECRTILTMKERAKEAQAKQESGAELFKRDKAGRVVKPRYELVTSHTARRTGITLLYLTGKFDIYQMMHVSGHQEAKTFREYIKLSSDEMAEQIAEKMGNDNLF